MTNKNNQLIDVYNEAIALLSPDQIYNRFDHQFQDDRSGKRRGRPPFRESKTRTSFTVFRDLGFYDAGDGFSGSPADYIHSMKIGRWERAKGREFVEAVAELCQMADLPFPSLELTPEQIEKAAYWERRRAIIGSAIAFCEQVLWTDLGLEARRYLNEERGLSEQDIKNLGLGYYCNHQEVVKVLTAQGFTPEEIKKAGLGSRKWNGYITYPWHDDQGRPLTIYGRYHQKQPPQGQPKTLALPGNGTKRSPLYLDKVLAHHHREAIFVEGVNDAAVLQTRGETRVLSGVAASFSNEQIETLKRRNITKIYHLGDPDGGGIGGTNSNLQRLTIAGITVYVPPQLPDGLDPDEFVINHGIEAFYKLIETSEHGFRWKAKQIVATHGTESDQAIESILQEAIAWTRNLPPRCLPELEAFFWPEIQTNIGAIDKDNFLEKLEQVESQPNPYHEVPPWKASDLAEYIAQRYQRSLAWNTQTEDWYRYEGQQAGIWHKETKYYIWQLIQCELRAMALIHQQKDKKGHKPSFSHNLVVSIENLLKGSLPVREWDEISQMLPFLNGVLNLKTMEFHQHDPGFKLTYCLPYQYNSTATCEPILDWLHQMTGGDPLMVEFLRAHLAAIVRGRSDLQSYLEILGPGGTGKGTLTRLATALIGDKNTVSTTLRNLEENRFDTARILGSKLVVITDAEKFGGEVSVLKALTGEDKLRFEQKYKQPRPGFYAQCRVIICANEAPQSSDYTSGLGRRRQTIYLTNKIPLDQQRNLLSINGQGVTGEFVDYLPGLLNWVLALPEAQMERIIKETPTSHPSFKKHKAQVLCETNPIADWLDQAVVYRPLVKTNIGVAKREKDSSSPNWFQCVNQWLYANYAEFCHNTGAKTLSLRRFVPLLCDLAINQLGLRVTKTRDRCGAFFEGLKLRSYQDDDPLLISGQNPPQDEVRSGSRQVRSSELRYCTIAQKLPAPGQVTDTVMDCDGNVTAETLTRDECDGCDGLLENEDKSGLTESNGIGITPKTESLNSTVLPSQKEPQTQTVTNCDGNQAQPSQLSQPVTEQPSTQEKISWSDLMAQIDQEMKRIGWSKQQGRRHLQQTYQVKSRRQLTDDQLFQFLDCLKSQPSTKPGLKPGQTAIFRGMKVVVQYLVNQCVAVVREFDNPKAKGFEVAIIHLT